MYIPNAFREDDIERLHAFIQEHNFAILVTMQDGVPLATKNETESKPFCGRPGARCGYVAR
jgi:predicted FMN-binding regulatory protein PaiB